MNIFPLPGRFFRKLLPYLLVVILFTAGQAWYRGRGLVDPPTEPPTDNALKLIDCMKKGEGWRCGRINNCIVNEKARIVVYHTKTYAKVCMWEEGVPKLTLFEKGDLLHINNAYPESRKRIEAKTIIGKLPPK